MTIGGGDGGGGDICAGVHMLVYVCSKPHVSRCNGVWFECCNVVVKDVQTHRKTAVEINIWAGGWDTEVCVCTDNLTPSQRKTTRDHSQSFPSFTKSVFFQLWFWEAEWVRLFLHVRGGNKFIRLSVEKISSGSEKVPWFSPVVEFIPICSRIGVWKPAYSGSVCVSN